ncbi:MAG: tetratricopeptide repeat protein [Bacteroidia bacterium]|nr:tetratricopeptide repeat protein [Bacteroidia bacterium]
MAVRQLLFLCLNLLFLNKLISQSDEKLFSLALNSGEDTSGARLCYEAGFKSRNSDPDITIELAEEGYHKARKCGNERWMAKHLMLWGLGFYKKGNWKKSIPYYLKAIHLQKQIPDSVGMLYSMINLANALEEGKMLTQADSMYHQALMLSEHLHLYTDRIRILNNLGVLNANRREYATALSLMHQAYKTALQKNNYELLAMTCNNYAGILLLQNRWENSRPWLEDALKYYSITENEFGKTDALVNLLQVSVRENNITEANEISQKIQQVSAWMSVPENRKEFLKWESIRLALSGDTAKAFTELLKHLHISDSLYQENRQTDDSYSTTLHKPNDQYKIANYILTAILLCLALMMIKKMVFKN